MNRAELVEILASKNDLSKTAANAVLETLIDTIQTAVKKGDAVQLVGFLVALIVLMMLFPLSPEQMAELTAASSPQP